MYVNLLKCSVVPEVLEVQVVASEEVSMVPKAPTATKQPLLQLTEEEEEELSVVAVLLSSDFAHEETSTAILTIRTNQEDRYFIFFL